MLELSHAWRRRPRGDPKPSASSSSGSASMPRVEHRLQGVEVDDARDLQLGRTRPCVERAPAVAAGNATALRSPHGSRGALPPARAAARPSRGRARRRLLRPAGAGRAGRRRGAHTTRSARGGGRLATRCAPRRVAGRSGARRAHLCRRSRGGGPLLRRRGGGLLRRSTLAARHGHLCPGTRAPRRAAARLRRARCPIRALAREPGRGARPIVPALERVLGELRVRTAGSSSCRTARS